MNDREKALENVLLCVIYEQCVYGGKVYAKLLIHGKEAFNAVGLKDGCDVKELEERIFKDDTHTVTELQHKATEVLERLKATQPGETICLNYEEVAAIIEMEKESDAKSQLISNITNGQRAFF